MPVLWLQLSPEEKTTSELHLDECVINNEHYFVKSVIGPPVRDKSRHFLMVSGFPSANLTFCEQPKCGAVRNAESNPPASGWLCNSIPGYPDTLHLKTMVHIREAGLRHRVELKGTDHPLTVEQREGITIGRVREIAERMHLDGIKTETQAEAGAGGS